MDDLALTAIEFLDGFQDKASRVVAVKHGDGSSESYAYGPDDTLVMAANADSSVQFERDVLGRVLREVCGKQWVRSEYGVSGARVELSSSQGARQQISRNAMGDVLSVRAGGFEARFKRDLAGLELSRELPGGVSARWERDTLGRPRLHEVSRGGQWQRRRSYTWDVNERLRAVLDELQGPTTFTHDAFGNLAAATYADGSTALRMPDAVGNLFRREERNDRVYGPAGELRESRGPRGVTRYTYDAEGNLVEKNEPGNRTWRYEWNAAGMMSQVTRPDGRVVRFTYDALGRRLSKTYAGKTTHWVWDGNVPLHEWVEVNDPTALKAAEAEDAQAGAEPGSREARLRAHPSRGPPSAPGTREAPITWTFEPESFSPLAKSVGGEHYAIITDHLGTPQSMHDGRGQEVWSAEIDNYGDLRNVFGERGACPFRWPGQYEDAETGLYYNRFRYYDPESGQYASQDPIGLAGGFAFYAYSADPLRNTDPFGLESCGPKIHPGKQGKHVPGHNNFQPGKSELTHPNPQALLDQGRGTGVPHGPTKEVVDFGEPIGTHVAPDGTRSATTRGTIHYSADKSHAHIVPAKPLGDL